MADNMKDLVVFQMPIWTQVFSLIEKKYSYLIWILVHFSENLKKYDFYVSFAAIFQQ